jgi:hypothetical protein
MQQNDNTVCSGLHVDFGKVCAFGDGLPKCAQRVFWCSYFAAAVARDLDIAIGLKALKETHTGCDTCRQKKDGCSQPSYFSQARR